ncbi:MAG: FAD-dependent 5-carboxymethylaminomethyl-2-thiouridine(34) oxidoreductase MnmC [Rubrivivax sp.]
MPQRPAPGDEGAPSGALFRARPLEPARIAWDVDGTPRSLDHDDVYHARVGAQAQARHVFLAGNDLPARWRGRADFAVLENGFGLGHNFLCTWRAWREDPARPQRLHYVALEARPAPPDDLARAHAGADDEPARALMRAWPPRVGGLHRLDFDDGAVRLLLAFGDVRDVLPALELSADAIYLDGFAPDRNPEMWELRVIKAVARHAAPDATLATWCVARPLRDALDTAGFVWQRVPGIGGKREVLRAVHRPRARRPSPLPVAVPSPEVLVIGAGLAGAACAAALAALGRRVEVLERAPQPAAASSGNPAGLFHATVHAGDGPYARLFRSAALHTARVLAALGPGRVPHDASGLLRLERDAGLDAMHALIDAQRLPPDHVQALPADAAAARAGVALRHPAWWYAQGGWASPPALVRAWLAHPGITLRTDCPVHALRRAGETWQALDRDGQVLAEAPQLVLANAEQANALLSPLGWPAFELTRQRGQVSSFAGPPGLLRHPVAGDGYVLPLPAGGLLCGATVQADDDDPEPRQSDHLANFARLRQLCGLQPPPDPSTWSGRVGWRVQPADRLPLAGPMPALHLPPGARLDQARLVPRESGLHLLVGLGARGLTLAPLLGELVAARLCGTPVPLPRDLIDHVDPARVLVRAARRQGRR